MHVLEVGTLKCTSRYFVCVRVRGVGKMFPNDVIAFHSLGFLAEQKFVFLPLLVSWSF